MEGKFPLFTDLNNILARKRASGTLMAFTKIAVHPSGPQAALEEWHQLLSLYHPQCGTHLLTLDIFSVSHYS